MTYKTVSNNEGTHVVLDGVEIAIKPDKASALDFIAGHATQRAEAAEARAAQAESYKWRVMPDENGEGGETWSAAFADCDMQRMSDESERDYQIRRVKSLQDTLNTVNSDLDEARRQLTEAQRAIDVLSNTVVAQDAEIKRLRQQREDVEQYRAEIERLNQAATA